MAQNQDDGIQLGSAMIYKFRLPYKRTYFDVFFERSTNSQFVRIVINSEIDTKYFYQAKDYNIDWNRSSSSSYILPYKLRKDIELEMRKYKMIAFE